MVPSGSTDFLVGGEVGAGLKAGAAGAGAGAGAGRAAANDGAEILVPDALAPAGALAGKLEKPP